VRTICEVVERVEETPSTVTLRFDYPPRADPGQFVMIWLPGDDELPMSLSYTDGLKGVTIKAMGATSAQMGRIAPGRLIGIRGPYGNRFDLSPRRLLVVGGGSGTAVLAPAAEEVGRRGGAITAALGGLTAPEVLFARRFGEMGARVEVATDDGSEGHHGFVTDVSDRLLREERFDAVWTCGPEIMMQKVLAAGKHAHVPVFCALERHMKCGLGICDACAFGPFHVCQDGPVFPSERIESVPEFGVYQRDASGRRIAQRGRR
jgi:dihydroorotate dehydrogenase electron transfer subunit